MSSPSAAAAQPITDRRDLVASLESGCKPPAAYRIGTEHEKFAYRLADLTPPTHEGPDGIGALLSGLASRFDWQPVREGGQVIALTDGKGGSITLEPGGQVELSGAPLETIHQTCAEVNTHLAQVKAISQEIGLGMIGLGFQPKWRRDDIPWMPKGRYAVMRRYMPTVGGMGLDMMQRTCTVQVNLDFESEADMVKKFRVSLALQPIATALFANSPFTDGKPNGFLSFRSHVWTDTDPERTGDLPFVFEDGFGFERYVDYLLDVPMYFVYRDGTYHDVAGQSFRGFLNGALPGFESQVPTLADWGDHMTTSFPEVRLKKFLEMRGTDGGPWRRLCALPALWVGLLYCPDALDAAWDIVKGWTAEDRNHLRTEVPRTALASDLNGRTVQNIALEVLEIARAGLEARARRDGFGDSEAHFLSALWEIAESGRTPAQELLDRFHGHWGGNIDPVFREYAY